jgi:hypothetical protein
MSRPFHERVFTGGMTELCIVLFSFQVSGLMTSCSCRFEARGTELCGSGRYRWSFEWRECLYNYV